MQELKIKGINKIAEIIICGAIRISVNECDGHTDFIVPTPEQRKNLKEMLCIDVKVLESCDGCFGASFGDCQRCQEERS